MRMAWRFYRTGAAPASHLCGATVHCSLRATMTNDERKAIIKKLLADGQTLSQIQDRLRTEHHDSITYMELRLLLSEMPSVKLPEKELPKAPTLPATPPPSAAATSPAAAAGAAGKLSISVDQMPAPGSMLSGYARFSSGAKAHWFLDQMGRLGLEPELGSGKPTQADMQEFSTEMRRMLQQAGGGY
jgi:hypothetical protein